MGILIGYDAATKTLSGSIIHKARKFNKLKLVKLYEQSFCPECKTYNVLPIEGYNKTMYTVDHYIKSNEFECNCQSSAIHHANICSHILAIMLYEKQNKGGTEDG